MEILAHLKIITTVQSQRVHLWRYSPDWPPWSQMHDMVQLLKKWLQLEELIELVILDWYLLRS